MERQPRNMYQVKNGNVIIDYFVVSTFEFGSILNGQTLELLTFDGKEINNFYLGQSYEIDYYPI
jgi:hypothetical protein